MVDGWRADGLTISHVARLLFNIIPSKGDYTIGLSGDFDTPWPDRVERAGMVLTSETPNPEYPIFPLSIDEWKEWTLKTQSTNWPRVYFYERSYPLGILHLLYVPTDANQIALYLEEALLPISATGDTLLDFPPGYQEAIESNLAVRIAAKSPGSNIQEFTVELSRSSLMLIKNANNRPLKRGHDFERGPYRTNVYVGNRYNG